MLLVDWTAQATRDLIEIIDYIELRNPVAAVRLHSQIVEGAERLPLFPYIFRNGRVLGTREYVVHPNYIIVYRVTEKAIEIIRLLHAKQEYPKD